MKNSRLYVIERAGSGGPQYWACSGEHGCGWHPDHPKQAFSPSELTREIRRLIDLGWFADLTVRELMLRCEGGEPGPSPRRFRAELITN